MVFTSITLPMLNVMQLVPILPLQQVPLPEKPDFRTIIIMLNTPTAGYPYFHVSSGIFGKIHSIPSDQQRQWRKNRSHHGQECPWCGSELNIDLLTGHISRICGIYSSEAIHGQPSRSTPVSKIAKATSFSPPPERWFEWGKYRPYRQSWSEKTGDGACLCGGG